MTDTKAVVELNRMYRDALAIIEAQAAKIAELTDMLNGKWLPDIPVPLDESDMQWAQEKARQYTDIQALHARIAELEAMVEACKMLGFKWGDEGWEHS